MADSGACDDHPSGRRPAALAQRDAATRGLEVGFGDRELGLRFFERPPAHRTVLHQPRGALHLEIGRIAARRGGIDRLLRVHGRIPFGWLERDEPEQRLTPHDRGAGGGDGGRCLKCPGHRGRDGQCGAGRRHDFTANRPGTGHARAHWPVPS